MRRTRAWRRALAGWGLAVAALAPAPAAPGYHPIERTIGRIQQSWQQPGARPQPNAPGWNALFETLRGDLRAYASATNEDDRLRALDRIYRISNSLQSVGWGPAAELREQLRAWLRPRVRLAWAERRLIDSVRRLPPATDAAVTANREQWVRFVEDDLGTALRQYEGATTVAERQEGLGRVYAALNSLDAGNRRRPWSPSLALETALNDLFNRPNLDLFADVNALAPALNAPIVQPGPIFFKGQWSYVSPGPKTGFGLLPSNDGIAFYNSQLMTSSTQINGFNEQVGQDPKGRRAVKLYHFDAASQDNSQLTITAVLGTNGLSLWPSYQHGVSAQVTSAPTQGHGLTRGIAKLIGFGQPRITEQVYDGAYPKIQQGVVEGAAELGSIKANEAAAQKNAQIRQYLIGNDTLAYRNLLIEGLSLSSQPAYAHVGGTIRMRGAGLQVGADAPEPAEFHAFEPGVVANVHLPSVATNMVRGLIQRPDIQSVYNLMLITKKRPPNTPPSEGFQVVQNADFATFSKAVDQARAANDPSVVAIRIKRPGRAPEFSADANGNLVVLVRDLALEVPAPAQAARGGFAGPPARIYLFSAPRAEITMAIKITPANGNVPLHVSARVVNFEAGPGSRVFAINDDEKDPTPLNAFTAAIAFRLLGSRLTGMPIEQTPPAFNLRGYQLASVSPIDPSGWLRVVLSQTGAPVRINNEPTRTLGQPQPRVAAAR